MVAVEEFTMWSRRTMGAGADADAAAVMADRRAPMRETARRTGAVGIIATGRLYAWKGQDNRNAAEEI